MIDTRLPSFSTVQNNCRQTFLKSWSGSINAVIVHMQDLASIFMWQRCCCIVLILSVCLSVCLSVYLCDSLCLFPLCSMYFVFFLVGLVAWNIHDWLAWPVCVSTVLPKIFLHLSVIATAATVAVHTTFACCLLELLLYFLSKLVNDFVTCCMN